MLLLKMLSLAYGAGVAKVGLRIAFGSIVLFVVMTLPVVYQYITANTLSFGSRSDYLLNTHLLLSVFVIVLVEQLGIGARPCISQVSARPGPNPEYL